MISMGFAIIISTESPANITGASVVITVGIAIVITSIKRMIKSFVNVFLPKMREKELVDIVYKERHLSKSQNVVAIGGGHGLSTLLHGLKEYTSNIAAVVTVADDGGLQSTDTCRVNVNSDDTPPEPPTGLEVEVAD